MAVVVTEELKREIHAAMEAAGGKTSVAAEVLGITTEQLSSIIHRHKELKLKWATSYKETPPPSEAVTIHRPELPLTLEEQEIAAAIEKEDLALRRSLKAMGVTDEQARGAAAMSVFQRQHYGSAIAMMGGGILKQFLATQAEAAEVAKRLNDPADVELRENLPLYIALLEHYRGLLDIMNKLYDRANQAALTQAKVRALLGGGNDKGPKRAKPGFAPLTVDADDTQE
jgi:hypothetical protein